jgi:PhnB protein
LEEKTMAGKVNPIPEGYRTVTPYLIVRGVAKAIDFYRKAFGAEEVMQMPGPGGKISHAEIKIGDSMVMMADENPEWGSNSPQALNGTPVGIFLYVPNVDATYKQAVDAGATPTMPPSDMFWGDRYGKLKDPFGHEWSLGTHIEDVPPAEMGKRQEEFFAQMAAKK